MREDFSDRTGQRIKSIRQALGLTQQELCQQLKLAGSPVSESSLQMWEIGTRLIKPYKMPALAKALGVTEAYLYGYTDVQTADAAQWRYTIPNGGAQRDKQVGKDFFALHIDQLRDKGFNERDILAIEVRDNSNDGLSPGDIVFLDTSIKTVTKPALFGIRANNGEIWLRNIKPEMHGGFTQYCSDKTNYPDQALNMEELEKLDIAGQYIGHFHWQD